MSRNRRLVHFEEVRDAVVTMQLLGSAATKAVELNIGEETFVTTAREMHRAAVREIEAARTGIPSPELEPPRIAKLHR